MTKKKPAKRIASNGPRLPGQPTKKTVKARARARKKEVPVVSAEDVRTAMRELISQPPPAELMADVSVLLTGSPEVTVDDIRQRLEGIEYVGQQAMEYEQDDPLDGLCLSATGHAQPVDIPVQVMPAYDVPSVTRRELRLNPPNLSPKQQRAKRRLEDGTGWRCLNCYRVLSPKLSGCPFCNTRKARP